MAAILVNLTQFIGLSTDMKPTTNLMPGSKFHELDTRREYVFDGVSWYLYSAPVQIVDPLPSGTNVIGSFGIDQTVGKNVVSFGATAQPVSITGSASDLIGAVTAVTTSGLRVQLPNIPCRQVTTIALKSNVGDIFCGGSNVSSVVYGVALEAKEAFTWDVANANQIYIDASISGEGISYVAI